MGNQDEVLLTGHVGPSRLSDGAHGNPFRQGSAGEFVTSDFNGFFYENTLRGNCFVYGNAAGGVAPVAATTTNAPMLWNPMGSNKNLVILKVVAALTATGTTAAGSIVYGTLSLAGSGIGTGAQIISLTAVAGVNLLLGSGNVSVMRFAPATVSTTGTPTLIGASGIGQATAATTATPVVNLTDWIYGAIIIPPGNTFHIMASGSIASTYCFGIYGIELPVALTA